MDLITKIHNWTENTSRPNANASDNTTDPLLYVNGTNANINILKEEVRAQNTELDSNDERLEDIVVKIRKLQVDVNKTFTN